MNLNLGVMENMRDTNLVKGGESVMTPHMSARQTQLAVSQK